MWRNARAAERLSPRPLGGLAHKACVDPRSPSKPLGPMALWLESVLLSIRERVVPQELAVR